MTIAGGKILMEDSDVKPFFERKRSSEEQDSSIVGEYSEESVMISRFANFLSEVERANGLEKLVQDNRNQL